MPVANHGQNSLQSKIEGQWLGEITGSNSGVVLLNLDREPERHQGSAIYADLDQDLGRIFARNLVLRRISGSNSRFSGTSQLVPLKLDGQLLFEKEQQQVEYPGVNFPDRADIEAELDSSGRLEILILTSLGQELRANLRLMRPGVSQVKREPEVVDWSSFKTVIEGLSPRRYIFRGQPQPWPLQTSFHRTRRKDLVRYADEDVRHLIELLSPYLRNKVDGNDPSDLAAIYSIAQHHGYPTPMLDWSYSPYIAAFFAYRRIPENPSSSSVRILAFDAQQWANDEQPTVSFSTAPPSVNVVRAMPTDNPRLVPQQGVFTLTNLWSPEDFILLREQDNRKRYLRAFDLPLSARPEILHELSTMGVTAASLFPGVDGTCEALRGRLFGDLTMVPRKVFG